MAFLVVSIREPLSDNGYVEYYFEGSSKEKWREWYKETHPEPVYLTWNYEGSEHHKWSRDYLKWLCEQKRLKQITPIPI